MCFPIPPKKLEQAETAARLEQKNKDAALEQLFKIKLLLAQKIPIDNKLKYPK